ncbi:colostrum trypsin inhibitor-like [Prionailurus iriomotensis]
MEVFKVFRYEEEIQSCLLTACGTARHPGQEPTEQSGLTDPLMVPEDATTDTMKFSLSLALCFPFCLVGIASSEKTSAHLEREAPQELLQTLPALCRLPAVEGPCRGRFYRYFYNSTAHECEHFTYGGCRGNANNFETTEMCLRVCKPPGSNVTFTGDDGGQGKKPPKTGPASS